MISALILPFLEPTEWKHGLSYCQAPGLHLCGRHAQSRDRGDTHYCGEGLCVITYFRYINLAILQDTVHRV